MIVSFINGIISVIESGINFVLGGIRKVLRVITPSPCSVMSTLPRMLIRSLGGYRRRSSPPAASSTPHLAMVGESGKEAIMPLENNTGWIDKLAEKLNGSGSRRYVVVNLKVYLDDGTLIDTIQQKSSATHSARMGRCLLNGDAYYWRGNPAQSYEL